MAVRLFLEPLDVWVFREARPFTAGSDFLARSRFPPSPYTLYGALRAWLLGEAFRAGRVSRLGFGEDPEAVANAVGGSDDFRRLPLRGPFLARRDRDRLLRYFPVPLDLALVKEEGPADVRLLTPSQEAPLGVRTSTGLLPLWVQHPSVPKGLSGFLEEPAFFRYVEGEVPGATSGSGEGGECKERVKMEGLERVEALYTSEWRTGVGLNREVRTAEEGLMYRLEYIRLQPGVGLVVDVPQGIEAKGAPDLLSLGGEARAARCWVFPLSEGEERPSQGLRRRVAERGRVKLVVATPAFFRGGWLPSWVDPKDWRTKSPYQGLRLVGAVVPRPERIGGFDLVARKPRPVRPAVPAGSVYFFVQEEEGAAQQALEAWFGRCLSEDDTAHIGFGLCYAGVW